MTTLGIGISVLVLFGHPSLGLLVLLVVHTWRCFWSLVRYSLVPLVAFL